jgi:hypothetical protein
MKKNKSKEDFYLEYSDGTPFVEPDFDSPEWLENVERLKKMQEELKKKQEENEVLGMEYAKQQLEGWKKVFEPYGTIITNWEQITEAISKRLRAGKESTIAEFHREFPAIREYLVGRNMMLPADAEQFFGWFFRVRHANRPFVDLLRYWPKIVPADFREFHYYKEHLFEHGGGMPHVPPGFFDIGKPEQGEVITLKVSEIKELPSLENAVKEPDKLPVLWTLLSEMESPFVTESGNIIGGKKARKHREVMALAQTITPLMKEGSGQFEVYSMLCKRLVLTESSRPERLPSKPGYDNIRLRILEAIRGLLK